MNFFGEQAIQYDALIENIIITMMRTIDDMYSDLNWDLVVLDALVHPMRNRATLLPVTIISLDGKDFVLADNMSHRIESMILRLHHLTTTSMPLSRLSAANDDTLTTTDWNKARLSISSNNSEWHKFEYKYDSDLAWLDSISVHNLDYSQLTLQEELAIKTWQGLPATYSRFWCKTRAI